MRPYDHHDPDLQADNEWACWFNGFACGVAVAGAIWLAARWLV